MILETTILPRKDGKVIARTERGAIIFETGKGGVLSCDVTDKDDIKFLLDTGNFSPANESDFDAAITLQAEPVLTPRRRGHK